MVNYYFGVEIEMIAKPHKVRNNLSSLHAFYYAKIADALRNRNLNAVSDDLTAYRSHPEHFDKWFITKDGSLNLITEQSRYLVPIEAVSPVLSLRGSWEHQIDVFWAAMSAVFHMPTRNEKCGSHIHLSKGTHTPFTLDELKTIAYGVTVYESCIQAMLMRNRATNRYCKPNTASSSLLRTAVAQGKANFALTVNSARDKNWLCILMQHDRYVLWNFANTKPGKSGTIEFRGGRFLRGKGRTKRWIAFTVSLIHWLLLRNHIRHPNNTPDYSPESFYTQIRATASILGIGRFLPGSYQGLNETM